MEFFVKTSVEKLWKNVFWNPEAEFKIVDDIRQNYNDEESLFHRNTRQTFLNEYDAVRNTKIPVGYNFPADPKLMQLYVAHKVKTDPSFLNLSGTGAGKTLSAILASRVIDSKMTLIVCPNDVVSTWQDTIELAFPDSVVKTGNEAFYAQYDESKHQYLVLSYDKFSQPYSQERTYDLVQEKIDFVVLDEIQFIRTIQSAIEELKEQGLIIEKNSLEYTRRKVYMPIQSEWL